MREPRTARSACPHDHVLIELGFEMPEPHRALTSRITRNRDKRSAGQPSCEDACNRPSHTVHPTGCIREIPPGNLDHQPRQRAYWDRWNLHLLRRRIRAGCPCKACALLRSRRRLPTHRNQGVRRSENARRGDATRRRHAHRRACIRQFGNHDIHLSCKSCRDWLQSLPALPFAQNGHLERRPAHHRERSICRLDPRKLAHPSKRREHRQLDHRAHERMPFR